MVNVHSTRFYRRAHVVTIAMGISNQSVEYNFPFISGVFYTQATLPTLHNKMLRYLALASG